MNFAYINEGDKQLFYFHGSKIGRKIDLINKNKYAGFQMDTNHMLKKSEEACKYSFKYLVVSDSVVELVFKVEEDKNRRMIVRFSSITKIGYFLAMRIQ